MVRAYEAAREVEITEEILRKMTDAGGAAAWVSRRARAWMRYWNEEIGRDGFYPFDLLAAAYVSEPGTFRCAEVQTWTGPDPASLIPFWTPTSMLVTQNESEIEGASAVGAARYCPAEDARLQSRLERVLTSGEGT